MFNLEVESRRLRPQKLDSLNKVQQKNLQHVIASDGSTDRWVGGV